MQLVIPVVLVHCREKDGLLQSFSIFIFVEMTTLVFSTKAPSIAGCQAHSFHVITLVNPDTLWRYSVNDWTISTEWKEVDFQDNYWSLKRSQFAVALNQVLFLRHSFEVFLFFSFSF